MNRRNRKKQALKRAEHRSTITIVVVIVGVLLVAGSLYAILSGSATATAALDYLPEDVTTNQPIHAVHEMGEGPPIPFLPKDQPQPKITLSETSYDFGTIGPRDIVERTFIVSNMGEGPLTISRAYTTCGCTTADISASLIPPGKVAEVTLTFDAGFHDTAGQTVRRGLIIENNDPRQSQAEIWIQAKVRSS